jgi:hypothetical protein
MGNHCPLVNRSSTATSKAAQATDRHLNLAEIDGTMLSIGLRMVLMRAVSSKQNERRGVGVGLPPAGVQQRFQDLLTNRFRRTVVLLQHRRGDGHHAVALMVALVPLK